MRTTKQLQRDAHSPHHKLFSIKNRIVIKGPNHSYRDFRVSANSIKACSNQRKAKEFFAPDKLVDTHAKDRSVYDFNQYGQRPEVFPVKVYTNADYNDGATKGKDQVLPVNANRSCKI